jgi:hypothetical protein
MMTKTNERIVVTINDNGDVVVEAHGFTGKGCAEATRALEEALGAPISRKLKAEWWQGRQAPVHVHLRNGQGGGGGAHGHLPG